MLYRTFANLKLQVEQELDTEGEEFIQEQELKNYFNSAITICEATIIKLGLKEKYLQAESIFSTVLGMRDYPLPADIVINKIRKVVYRNSTDAYTLKPFTSEEAYAYEDMLSGASTSGEWYGYSLYKTGNIQMMRLIPAPTIAIPNAIRIVYFKSLNRYINDTDVCDLPEVCYEYLLSYVRYRVMAKESPQMAQDEKANMQALLSLMQETMSDQVADPDMDINDGDMSHYLEMN